MVCKRDTINPEPLARPGQAGELALLGSGIDTVAMESTGVYWIPLYEILEERGFEVLLVNAHHVKNVPGRKTDVLDCQWLQELHTYGLLRGSFRPPAEIVALRTLVRHRETLVQEGATYIQRMQKALVLMNVQLTPSSPTSVARPAGHHPRHRGRPDRSRRTGPASR